MFSVPDILVVSVLALLLFGPDRLPKVMRQAGKFMRDVQNTSQSFISEMERAADVAEHPVPVPAKLEPLEPQPEGAETAEAVPHAADPHEDLPEGYVVPDEYESPEAYEDVEEPAESPAEPVAPSAYAIARQNPVVIDEHETLATPSEHEGLESDDAHAAAPAEAKGLSLDGSV
jgi:TatA/E family protein of Tat protein translocase